MDLKPRFTKNLATVLGVLTVVLSSFFSPTPSSAAGLSAGGGTRGFLPLITGSGASPAVAPVLALSKSPNRTNALSLEGQIVAGQVYIFLSRYPATMQVRFYLDNTPGAATPSQVVSVPPFDFAGGTADASNPYDTGRLANGRHTITAAVALAAGGETSVTTAFTVSNGDTRGSSPIYWGVNLQGVPWDLAKLSTWERDVAGKAVSIINWGHFWGDDSGNYQSWSSGAPNNARSHGAIPMISWSPEGGPADKWQLGGIIGGAHDAYIRQFARGAKAWAFPFFLRIMHEMNGTWGYNWQETQNGNTKGQFIPAWRHIVDIFRAEGVTNASFVWCPNIAYPNTSPTFAEVYPGDSYVDWTCLDGYNWGTTRSSGWQSFDTVYNWSYNEILKIASSKPMMIGEFGSAEQGGSKAAWLADTLGTQIPSRYGKIRAAVYFNWQFDAVDWRIETTQTAVGAWKKGITSPYYASNQFGGITGKVAVP